MRPSQPNPNRGALLFAALAASTLVSCAQPRPSAEPATKHADPRPVVASPADGTCGRTDFGPVAVRTLNAYRAAGARCGLAGRFASGAPLRWNDLLERAARVHSADMARHDRLDHTGSDGREPSQRVDAVGYTWTSSSENIAVGPSSVEAVMAGWMRSDGHCANMMDPDMRDAGLACVSTPSGQRYWTLVLARSR